MHSHTPINREEPRANQQDEEEEDGRRKEKHREWGVRGRDRGEGWSHEQGEAEHRAKMPAGLCLARKEAKSLH